MENKNKKINELENLINSHINKNHELNTKKINDEQLLNDELKNIKENNILLNDLINQKNDEISKLNNQNSKYKEEIESKINELNNIENKIKTKFENIEIFNEDEKKNTFNVNTIDDLQSVIKSFSFENLKMLNKIKLLQNEINNLNIKINNSSFNNLSLESNINKFEFNNEKKLNLNSFNNLISESKINELELIREKKINNIIFETEPKINLEFINEKKENKSLFDNLSQSKINELNFINSKRKNITFSSFNNLSLQSKLNHFNILQTSNLNNKIPQLTEKIIQLEDNYSKAKELIFSLKENNEKYLKSLNETLEINKKLEEKNRNLEQNNSIEPKESFNKIKEEIWGLIKTISPNIIPLDLMKINEKDIPLDKFSDLLNNFKEDLNKRTRKMRKYKEK